MRFHKEGFYKSLNNAIKALNRWNIESGICYEFSINDIKDGELYDYEEDITGSKYDYSTLQHITQIDVDSFYVVHRYSSLNPSS